MRFRGAVAVVGVLLWSGSAAWAEYSTDRFKLEGQFSMQPTFQHNDTKSIEYVQQRQEVRLGLVYHLVPLHGSSSGFFKKADMSLLWRGRYDAVYDIRQSYKDRNYDRQDFRFPEGDHPRELFADVEFNRGFLEPLSIRVGRQQVVWGEADFFRSLDVINPLRIDQMSLVGDDLDNYREPLWIVKALYNFGDFNQIAGLNLETFYSPDGRPLTNKLILGDGWRIFDDFDSCVPRGEPISCLRPHQFNFRRIRHPWEIERVGPEYSTAPDQGDLGPLLKNLVAQGIGVPGSITNGKADFIYLGNQKYGDRMNIAGNGYNEIDLRRNMAGARLMGQTAIGGLYFTLNYIYKRSEIPAPYIGWETLFDPNATPVPTGFNIRPSVLTPALAGLAASQVGNLGPNQALLEDCVKNSTPLLILGPTATPQTASGNPQAPSPMGRSPYGWAFPNQSLGAACVPVKLWYPYTHILGGTLTYNDYKYTGFIWRMEESLSTKEPRTKYPALAGTRAGQFPNASDFSRGGKESTAIWRSMIGFDYLRSPFNVGQLPGFLKTVPLTRSLLTDQWFFTFQFFNEYWSNVSNQLGQDFSLTNRHEHWNPMLTWIMTGFFMHETLRPTLAFAYETDTSFPVLWLQAQYFLSPRLQVRVGEVNYMGSAHAENFLFLNKYSDRDTTYVRFTYFFL
jgi:hypothetical protein